MFLSISLSDCYYLLKYEVTKSSGIILRKIKQTFGLYNQKSFIYCRIHILLLVTIFVYKFILTVWCNNIFTIIIIIITELLLLMLHARHSCYCSSFFYIIKRSSGIHDHNDGSIVFRRCKICYQMTNNKTDNAFWITVFCNRRRPVLVWPYVSRVPHLAYEKFYDNI